MAKVTLNNVASGYNRQRINSNFQDLETELNNKVLYRDNPTGEANQMENDLDMNSNDVTNAKDIYTDRIRIDGKWVTGQEETSARGADTVTYDNTTSGLTATEVQSAIDEIDATLDTRGTAFTADVGTNPDEVPTNADLGSAAYVDESDLVAKINSMEDFAGFEGVANQQVSSKEYHLGTGVGGGDWWYNATLARTNHNGGPIISPARNLATEGLATFLTTVTDTDLGCWVRKDVEYVTPEMFGAVGDGVADDTGSLQALDGKKWQGARSYLIDAIDYTSETHGIILGGGSIKLDTPSVANTPGITLSANGSTFFSRGICDGNSTSRTIVQVAADDCTVEIDGAINVTADVGAGSGTSGIHVASANHFSGYCLARNFSNTGSSNDSLPRIITCDGTSQDFSITKVQGNSVRAGLVVGGSAKGAADVIDLVDALDNGIYALGGTLSVGRLVYDGSEESVVYAGGDVTVNELIIRSGITSIGLDGNDPDGALSIDSIVFEKKAGTDGPSGFIRTRSTGAVGSVHIGSVAGVIRPFRLFSLNTGTVESLSIDSMNLNYEYDSGISDSVGNFGLLEATKEFHLHNMNVNIIDATADIGSGIYGFTLPTTNLARRSTFNYNYFTLYDSDGVTKSTSPQLRINNLGQELISFAGVGLQTSIGPYGRDTNYAGLGWGAENVAQGIPGAGTWRRNTVFYNLQPVAGGKVGWVCVTAGTPGTWKAFGSIDP